MKRFRVTWTKRAARNLDAQIDHIAKDSVIDAARQRDRIIASVSQLYTFPASGRPGRIDGTRELVAAPWVIIYQVIGGRVEVLRVLHSRQKFP